MNRHTFKKQLSLISKFLFILLFTFVMSSFYLCGEQRYDPGRCNCIMYFSNQLRIEHVLMIIVKLIKQYRILKWCAPWLPRQRRGIVTPQTFSLPTRSPLLRQERSRQAHSQNFIKGGRAIHSNLQTLRKREGEGDGKGEWEALPFPPFRGVPNSRFVFTSVNASYLLACINILIM